VRRTTLALVAVLGALLTVVPAAVQAKSLGPVSEVTGEISKEAPKLLEPVAEATGGDAGGTKSPGTENAGGGAQGYVNYPAPETLAAAHDAQEPSIGVDMATDRALLLLNTAVARVTWDDKVFPPTASWDDASPVDPPVTLDPMLYTDRSTNRTFLSNLEGMTSYNAITDDGGDSWTPTQPATAAPSFDHQSLGAGPYPASMPNPGVYPNAVYYCAQLGLQFDVNGTGYDSAGECARSDTGGLTWNPPLPANVLECAGLHGKPVVAKDGSVLIPHSDCEIPTLDGRAQGAVISRDAGLTWSSSPVPGTTPSNGDPAIAVDAAGRTYFLGNRDGRPVVATSDDAGATWGPLHDVGGGFPIGNNEFSMAIAGDAGRAAVAFLGTSATGDDQAPDFPGVWHLFVASTFDGGTTWSTVDATPTDPVQRGCIWMGGGDNPCRNLLDFDTITADSHGRVLVGYADGCTGPCALDQGTPAQSRDTLGTIARQTTGKTLLAAYDPVATQPIYATVGGPYSTTTGTPVTLSASAIGGSSNTAYTYTWDFDGDGKFDDARGPVVAFTSSAVGDHAIGVRVSQRRLHDDAATTVTVRSIPAVHTVAAWTFDGADGACDDQGWTDAQIGLDPLGDEPRAQTVKWHTVASQAASPACALSHAIDGLGTYPPLQYARRQSPCVDLTGLQVARLEFHYAGELETDDTGTLYDFLSVSVAPCDGSEATELPAKFGGPAGDLDATPPSYANGIVDLSAFAGKPVVVNLVVRSDDSVQTRGYQVDDVRVIGG
jgi:hypothetical protein